MGKRLGLKPVALTVIVTRDLGTGQDENSSFIILYSVKAHPCELRGYDFGDDDSEGDKRRRPKQGSVPSNSATRQLKPMSHCSSLNSDLSGG